MEPRRPTDSDPSASRDEPDEPECDSPEHDYTLDKFGEHARAKMREEEDAEIGLDAASPPSAPSGGREGALTCHRQTPRQATSAVAYSGEAPEEDDPLLGFAPVPHKAPRRNSITPELQRRFIAHLAATGVVTEAARHIGKSMEAIYKLRQRPGAEGFSAAWDAAIDRGVARLESGALTRAIKGEERMVVSAGKVLGTEVRHNEALVMFFLRNRRAARYDQQKEIGPGHPVYERVKAEYAEEQRRIANDPAQIKRIHRSLNNKMAEWRAELEARWEAEHRGEERPVRPFEECTRIAEARTRAEEEGEAQ